PFTLRVHGRSGHASMPGIADNALVKAARHVVALGEHRPERTLIPEARAFLEVVLGGVPPLEEALPRLHELEPMLPALVEPLLALTFSPTMIQASRQRNVVPALCEVTVDCRLLPEQTVEQAEAIVRGILGEGDYDLVWQEVVGGTRSSLDSPLWEAISAFASTIEPGAVVAPIASPGFTDSHYLRQAFGTVAYGFFPIRALDPELVTKLVHSANERIAVDDLELGTDLLRHVARALLGGAEA
ncbi:MAG TPA: M20/M25/M40 family metallo-hydrolase, partial [Gaiellaceae bacterium]|nr:M20/M25/M40 family metallo-hydrolase [Gaiellaceae bacterium]